MPQSFPDFDSLRMAAQAWDFRRPKENETEPAFRDALADHVLPSSPIESMEIRTGKGWDEWTAEERREMMINAMCSTGRT